MPSGATSSIAYWTLRRKASRDCMKHSRVPAPHRRLIIATGNAGKLREIRALLAGLPFDVVAQSELGVKPPEETGSSFASNALLKARHAALATGAAALADDSGLEVDALG